MPATGRSQFPGPTDDSPPVTTLPHDTARPARPFSRRLGQLYVVSALLINYGVTFRGHPTLSTLFVMTVLVTFLACTPAGQVRRARLPVWSLVFLCWLVCSVGWTVGPTVTLLGLRTLVPSLVGLVIVSHVLDRTSIISAVRAFVRLGLAVNLVALALDAGARSSPVGDTSLAAWRGTFVDKNTFALFLVLCVTVTVAFDRRTVRAVTLGVAVVLLVGSQSVTGLIGAVLVMVFARWLALVRRQEARGTSTFVAATVALVGVTGVGVLANATTLFQLFGKDPNLTGRTEIWSAVTDAIAVRPELGYGLGALIDKATPTQTTLDLWRVIGFEAAHSHNGVLDLVGQVGVVGLVLFALMLSTTLRRAVRSLPVAPSIATFALTFTAAQLLISISESVFLNAGWLTATVIIQALLLRHTSSVAGSTRVGDSLVDAPRADVSSLRSG